MSGAAATGPGPQAGHPRDVLLRPMEGTDLARVAALDRELFGLGAWSVHTFEEELAAPGRRYVAAEGPAGLIGYAGIALGADAEIMTIGVDAAWRRRAIGTALLGALLAAAREAGCRRVFLEVRTDSDGARRLYERAGFAGTGIRRGYYQPEGADALVMRLDLAGPGPLGAPGSGAAPGGTTAGREEDQR